MKSRMVPQGYFHYFFTYLHEEDEGSKNHSIKQYLFVDDKAQIVDVNPYD